MSSDIPTGVRVEPVYLVEAQYMPDAAEKRPPVRPEHLARIARLRDEGTIIEAGAYSDRMSSSILLVQAEDADAALAIARADVYVKAGVWGEIDARPFGRVVTDKGQAARASAAASGG